MEINVDILEALIGLSASVYFYLYYSGRLKLSEQNELTRQARVKKYGVILIIIIAILVISSAGLLYSALLR